MAAEMPRPGRTVHCSLQPAGFGLLEGLVSLLDERGGKGHRFAGSQARPPMLTKPNARQFITSGRPPASSHVFLEAV